MTDTLRIKRRAVGGAAGPPASLAASELAYNEQDDNLYYGKGNSAGAATSIIAIAGPGFVSAPSSTTPLMDGIAAVGTGTTYARADHVHPSDTSRAPLASPTFTGTPTAPTPAAADNSTKLATTAFVQGTAPTANVGRNLLHNGLFNIAQRGTGPFTTAVYTLDRWLLGVVTDTASIQQVALLDGDRTLLGDESAAYCLRNAFTGNAAAGAYNVISERIENVRRLAATTVTVSFWATCTSGTPKLGVSIDQYFGTTGSAQVNGNGQSVTISTTWTRYSLTFAVASIIGKTVSGGGDFTGLNFWFSSGATNATRAGNIGVQSNTVQLWGIQLEIGSLATPLEKLDPRNDLANCQRFYQSQSGNIIWSGSASNTISNYIWVPFVTTLRAVPTVTAIDAPSSGFPAVAPTVQSVSAGGFQAFKTANATGQGYFQFTYTASADL